MRLHSLTYTEYPDDAQLWSFKDLVLGNVNLLVGMNASGKTRTLNVINGLASLFSERLRQSGEYTAKFVGEKEEMECAQYSIRVTDSEVISESLRIGGRVLLLRKRSGRGKLRAEEFGKDLEFKVPKDQPAAVAKRDALQHPFLEALHNWGESVKLFKCSTTMGKDKVLFVGKGESLQGDYDIEKPIDTFLAGCKRFGLRNFKAPILRDMRDVGYRLSNITVAPPTSRNVVVPLGEVVCLHAHERDLECSTDQLSMSDGMFRVLALLIQVNYLVMANPTACVLIDDIGEGLDYERSNALIKVIRQKPIDNKMQLVMATNDRYVMNNVPLDEWQVVDREGHQVHFRTRENSRKAFEEFEFTGMSNFDFFRSGFFAETE